MRIDGALLRCPGELLFDRANRPEILIELPPVGRAQPAAQRARIVADEVEDAAAVQRPAGSRIG
jgi:hypothetical protein